MGIVPKKIYGVMAVKEATPKSKYANIRKLLTPDFIRNPLTRKVFQRLEIIPGRWSYFTPVKPDAPFPIDLFYDSKAWQWLVENINKLEEPILFWNIGGNP